MAKDIVIIPASGQIELSGSSTHINVLTAHSQSLTLTGCNEFVVDGGNIVANQYIVSSSVTHMTSSAMSGSTIFGDSGDDKHLFTGSIEILSGSLQVAKETNGGNSLITIINSDTDSGTDKGAGVEFRHAHSGGTQVGGMIIGGKDSSYQSHTSNVDSNLQFYTANDNSNIERLRIDSTGLSIFHSNISASGHITASGLSLTEKNITDVGTIFLDRVAGDAQANVNIDLNTNGIQFTVQSGDTFGFNTNDFNDTSLVYQNSNEDTIFQIDSTNAGQEQFYMGPGIGGTFSQTVFMEGTVRITSTLTASGDLVVGDDIFLTDDIYVKNGTKIGDVGGPWSSGNDDYIKFDMSNRRIETFIDNARTIIAGNGAAGIGSDVIPTNHSLTVGGSNSISASGNIKTDRAYWLNANGTQYPAISQSSTYLHIGDNANGDNAMNFHLMTAGGNSELKVGDAYNNKFLFHAGDGIEANMHVSASKFITNGAITASSTIMSYDNILVRDGGPTGDKIVDILNSSDDGLIRVYQNNSVKARIHGNGTSYFDGGNVGIGTGATVAKPLTVVGDISASGTIHGNSFQVKNTTSDVLLNPGGLPFMSYEDDGIKTTRIGSDDMGGTNLSRIELLTNAGETMYVSHSSVQIGSGANSPSAIPAALHVKGNISASGTITAQEFHTEFVSSSIIYESGSTQFGDTLDDTHNFSGSLNVVGNITSSGNISSSGQLYGNILNARTRVKAIGSSLEFAGNELNFVDGGSTGYLFRGIVNGAFEAYHSANKKLETTAGGINVTGHITSSGNISSSGTIEANGDFIVNSSGRVGINTTSPDYKLDVAGNVGVNEYIYHNGDSNTYLRYQADQVDLSAGGNVATLKDNGFSINHITASGNISASGNGSFTGTLRADGNVDFNGDLDVDGTTNLDAVDIDGNIDAAGSITMASNQFFYFDEDQICAWRAYNSPGGRIMMNRIGGVGGLMSMSGSAGNAYVGINTGTAGNHANIGLTVNGMVSASSGIYAGGVQAVSGSGEILNRYQLSFDYQGRVTAVGKHYTKGDRGGFANYSTQLASGNPSGSAVTYLAAARYSSYTAPRACKLIRMQHTMLNYTNDDDIFLGVYKGTAVNDSNSNITLSQIGTDVGGSMSEDKTYMYQTDFSSGNDLAAGDFILFCIHTPSLSSTSYPRFNINLELQYT